MPTYRRFTWQYQPPDPAEAVVLCAQVKAVLGVYCEAWPAWYSEPAVTGSTLGIVEFSITVSSRDQWWVLKRVRRLLYGMSLHTTLPVLTLQESVDKLPPHEHRGKSFRKAYRDGGTDRSEGGVDDPVRVGDLDESLQSAGG